MEPQSAALRRNAMTTPRREWLAVTVLALLAACGTAGGASRTDGLAGMGDLEDRTFASTLLVDGADPPLRPNTTVTLSFTNDALSGSAGCNTLYAKASLSNGRLVVQGMSQTDMGCPGRQFHDQWMSDLLTDGPAVMLDGDHLTLTSGGTIVELQDERTSDPDRPLVGTTWTLETLEDGSDADSASVGADTGVSSTLRFGTDGELAASPGCNRGSARYRFEADTIALDPIVLTRMACDGPAMNVESDVVQILDGVVSYEIVGSRLRLTRDRRTLVYRAG